MAKYIVVVYRAPAANQEGCDNDGGKAEVDPEIGKTPTHPRHQSGIASFYGYDYNKQCENSEGDAQ
jgi:hypothetical protein